MHPVDTPPEPWIFGTFIADIGVRAGREPQGSNVGFDAPFALECPNPMTSRPIFAGSAFAVALSSMTVSSARANDGLSTNIAPFVVAETATPPTGNSPAPLVSGYFESWFDRVDQALATQPHWVAPLITTTPLLVEQFRYDINVQQLGNGAHILNLGTGKGLELIPTTSNEIFVSIPPYQERTNIKPVDGFTDWQFLLIKQRLLSANENNGNYVLSAFLAAQAPIGIPAFTNHAYVVSPTLAGGKGFGDFVVQATSGFAVPTAHENSLGTTWANNVTFQYHIAKIFWPEFEVNWTHWLDGTQRGGKDQVFLTIGAVVGAIKLTDRLSLALGAGYQWAVAPQQELKPVLTPTFKNNLIFSARLPF
jgi:hypothetical protein